MARCGTSSGRARPITAFIVLLSIQPMNTVRREQHRLAPQPQEQQRHHRRGRGESRQQHAAQCGDVAHRFLQEIAAGKSHVLPGAEQHQPGIVERVGAALRDRPHHDAPADPQYRGGDQRLAAIDRRSRVRAGGRFPPESAVRSGLTMSEAGSRIVVATSGPVARFRAAPFLRGAGVASRADEPSDFRLADARIFRRRGVDEFLRQDSVTPVTPSGPAPWII